MAKYIGQVAGVFYPYTELINQLEDINTRNITKIGLQLPEGSYAIIDGKEFEIGQTGILEFEDIKISSVTFRNRNIKDNIKTYIIMDCIYSDIE